MDSSSNCAAVSRVPSSVPCVWPHWRVILPIGRIGGEKHRVTQTHPGDVRALPDRRQFRPWCGEIEGCQSWTMMRGSDTDSGQW